MNATGVHWIVPHKAGCVALCDQETLDDGTLGKCLDSERKSWMVCLGMLAARASVFHIILDTSLNTEAQSSFIYMITISL